ncbi:MAG: matrixin family metalloprotease [Nanoarchaeota archaeon]
MNRALQILIICLLIGLIFFYSNRLRNIKNNEQDFLQKKSEQVMPELVDYYSTVDYIHWNHMPLTYYFNEPNASIGNLNCTQYQIKRVKDAFQIFENETDNLIYFREEKENPDIKILCYGVKPSEDYMIMGEGSFEFIDKMILRAELNFFNHRNCGTFPDIEIHEILHIFGFRHSEDKTSIMYPIENTCDHNKIDEEIIEKLKQTYLVV